LAFPKPITNSNLSAILLMVFAMTAFALADALIRVASLSPDGGASAGQMLVMQGVIGMLFFQILMVRRKERLTLEVIKNRFVLLRTSSDILAALCFVSALTLMPVGEASAILQVQPLVVTFAAVIFLNERVGIYRWSAIFVGFIGVLIILRPSSDGFDPAAILVLFAVVGLSARDIFTRKLPKHLSTLPIITFVCITLIPAGYLLHRFTEANSFFQIPINTFFIAVVSASSGMIGYYALTNAMRIGEISIVAPYRYSRLIAAFLFSWVLLGEIPDSKTILGSIIIVGAGISVIYRERNRKAS
jgi:drug/metabolite transporter (DMT)-like permease